MMSIGNNRQSLSAGRFGRVERKSVKVSSAELVTTSYLNEQMFPLIVEPNLENVNLISWAAHQRDFIETQLLEHGAILFRNFDLSTVSQFEQFAQALAPSLLEYHERAAPRTEVGGKVYTSTEYPADQVIPLHHEMSYSHNWPTKLWFFCQQPARQGGQTPIASDRQVFSRIAPRIKEHFMQKKVMYVRNYGKGLDLSWQETFQTHERSVVEKYCREAHTEFEWRSGDRLHTRQVRQAVAVHPKTGETVWFNHAHMFHQSNLTPLVRDSLLAEFKEDELPRNAFYGDGSPIESAVLEEIRDIYNQSAVTFSWQQNDILMLDNFLASHGREPFVGPRRVLVAMAELYTNEELELSAKTEV